MTQFFGCTLRRTLFITAFISAIGVEILGVVFHLRTQIEDYSSLSIGIFSACLGITFISRGNEISSQRRVKGLIFKVIGFLWVASFVFSIGYIIQALTGI